MHERMTNQNEGRTVVIHGNEACVLGAIAAGCRFFAGYPITPASEIAEIMARLLPKNRGVFLQMEDEIASICAALGAAWGGVKACTATSGPGFTLKQEGIGWAAETDTPIVVINVMRGGPATGQPTSSAQQDVMQARYGSHGDYEIIALTPSSVQEAFDLTVKAFNLAEIYRNPVIVLSDEIIGHTREKIRIPGKVEVVPRQKPADGRRKPMFLSAPEPTGSWRGCRLSIRDTGFWWTDRSTTKWGSGPVTSRRWRPSSWTGSAGRSGITATSWSMWRSLCSTMRRWP